MRAKLQAISLVALATCLASAGVALAQSASRAVLESVETTTEGGAAVVTIGFVVPLRYVSQFPETQGSELRITVAPAGALPDWENEVRVREAVKPASFDARAPVEDVVFERDETGASGVTVRFAREVRFRASQGRDLRTIRIELPAEAGVNPAREKPGADAGAVSAAAPLTAAAVVEAMTAADEAMAAGDYDLAIRLYTSVVDSAPSPPAREAREMLGVARERNGQLAHAKAEYERYLEAWPEGEDADRVRQRLNSLVGRGSKPKEKLREVARDEGWSFDEWGSFSTFYRRDARYTDEEGDETTQSIADTNLDLGLRASRGENDLRLAFNGGYTLDLLESDDNEADIDELYFQYARTQSWISARAGRQSRSKGGVLGRFDGMLLGYKPVSWANVNVAAGFPVRTWEDAVDVDDERRFAGISVDLGTFAERWDFNLFFIDQEIADVTDRRAVGGELRYLDQDRSLFALLDYDVFYDVLNTAYVIASTKLPFDMRGDASLRYGTTPILTTSNALIGQPFDSMDELLDVFSNDEVYDLARDRTADGVTFTASAIRELTEKFQLNGDFAYSTISSTDTSGGVDEIPETGDEFFYGLQLIGSGVFKQGDVSVAGLRFSDGDTANVVSLDLHTRLPVRTAWWLGPRLIFDYEPSGDGDDSDLRVRPRLRVEYKWRKHHRFEVEGGGQYLREGSGSDAENVYGYTAEAGYRFDF